LWGKLVIFRALQLVIFAREDSNMVGAMEINPTDNSKPEEEIMSGLDRQLVLLEDKVRGGDYWTGVIKRGRTVRIIDPHGCHGVSLLCYNADNYLERLNVADTAKIQFNAFLKKGMVLYSDMGRILFSITEDTSGCHDLISGASNGAGVRAKYGESESEGDIRDSRTNFLKGLARWGLTKRDLMPNLNLFTRIAIASDGSMRYDESCVKPNSYIDLRAEMNVLVVLSNCPNPLHPSPVYQPPAVFVQVWNSPAPTADDLCRNANPEVIRGFINTDRMFVQ
jgi:urea carboxylase-associated protein 2